VFRVPELGRTAEWYASIVQAAVSQLPDDTGGRLYLRFRRRRWPPPIPDDREFLSFIFICRTNRCSDLVRRLSGSGLSSLRRSAIVPALPLSAHRMVFACELGPGVFVFKYGWTSGRAEFSERFRRTLELQNARGSALQKA
jgi:hypothetical protein